MKVLFLDIDGVLNCKDNFRQDRGFTGIEPYRAFMVGKIKLDTGCEVVLSSSWRHLERGIEEVQTQVCKLYDITPVMYRPVGTSIEYCERGREIKAWLEKHPEVTRYAILDDENDMLPEQQEHFFKTSFYNGGLTPGIAELVTRYLNE